MQPNSQRAPVMGKSSEMLRKRADVQIQQGGFKTGLSIDEEIEQSTGIMVPIQQKSTTQKILEGIIRFFQGRK